MNVKKLLVCFVLFLLVGCSKDGYRIEGNRVIYEIPWNAGNFTVIKEMNADPKTFEVLGEDNLSWAKDGSKVFRRFTEIDGVDSSTFELLSINFAKDKNSVLCGRDIIVETNPNDFKIRHFTGNNDYTYIYGIDKQAAYLCSREPNGYQRILTNSIDSFEQLDEEFYKDDDKVWWGGLELPNVNSSTFRVLEGGYATDGNIVYYHPRIVKGADPETFVVTSNFRAKDKNHKYFMDEIDD